VTDPPYGQGFIGGAWGGNKVANDEDTTTRDAALEAWGKKPALVFGNWRCVRPKNVIHRLIWNKEGRNAGILATRETVPWFPADEEIYILGKGWVGPPDSNIYATTENRSSAAKLAGHPTPKPIRLMEQLIAKAPQGILADPFSGSGATLVAAKNLGRKVIGVELEEKYCELIAKRLSQDTFDFSKLTKQVKPTYTQESLI
jgi:hypothetical protein